MKKVILSLTLICMPFSVFAGGVGRAKVAVRSAIETETQISASLNDIKLVAIPNSNQFEFVYTDPEGLFLCIGSISLGESDSEDRVDAMNCGRRL